MNLKTTYYKNTLQQFDTHIVSTKSVKTGNHYTGQANEFLMYLEAQDVPTLKQVTTQLMKDYYSHLITRPKKRGTGTLGITSINDNLSTLRMLSIRMQKDSVIVKALPVPNNIKIERDENNLFSLTRQILTIDEVKEVFDTCENDTERALIALAYGSGLRRSTLANLKDRQIDFANGMVTALKAKNNKTREVPISDFFIGVLKTYSLLRLQILTKSNPSEQRFFVDQNGRALSGHRLNEMLKRIVKKTNNQTIMNKKITLHCLRHSIATHLMDAGQTFEYVKTFLGHSFVDTSTLYAKRRKFKNYYAI